MTIDLSWSNKVGVHNLGNPYRAIVLSPHIGFDHHQLHCSRTVKGVSLDINQQSIDGICICTLSLFLPLNTNEPPHHPSPYLSVIIQVSITKHEFLKPFAAVNMCFYGYVSYRCRDCDVEFEATTIKKRDCRKKSCNKIVAPGDIRPTIRKMTHPRCDCHILETTA